MHIRYSEVVNYILSDHIMNGHYSVHLYARKHICSNMHCQPTIYIQYSICRYCLFFFTSWHTCKVRCWLVL